MATEICRSIPAAPALGRRGRLRNLRCFTGFVCRRLTGHIRIGLRREQGATLVETTLASLVLFALLIGIFEVVLGLSVYHYTSSAARQGSRYAIVRGSACSTNLPAAAAAFHCNASAADIAAYVKGLGYPGIDSANAMTVSVTTCNSNLYAGGGGTPTTGWSGCTAGTTNNDPGDQVQVTVTYNFPLAVPFWNQQTVGITSTSSMVYSQ